jgi:hypothetical protein
MGMGHAWPMLLMVGSNLLLCCAVKAVESQ